ncbi:MAG TPA: hypothetical protein DDX02_08250 [Clostridiaceae bacterium]|nr:hypothetical protein [Clostridiaceae bacterium]
MRINKKGSVGLIICGVYIAITIAIFYTILTTHNLTVERKNNIDFAVNDAISVNKITSIEKNTDTWMQIFKNLLKENCNNDSINYIYLLKKDNDMLNLYTVDLATNQLNTITSAPLSSSYYVLNIVNSFINNKYSLEQVEKFAADNNAVNCLIINKTINNKLDKDYVYIY